jgi:hypothetical protein
MYFPSIDITLVLVDIFMPYFHIVLVFYIILYCFRVSDLLCLQEVPNLLISLLP